MSPLIPRAIADFTTQLSSAISVGSVSFTIASILDDDSVSIPDGKYCFTIDNGSSDKEYLMGDNVAGTISNVKSVSRQGVETTGAARAHRIGASVILTDFAVIQRVADILRGSLTLDGSSPLAYDTSPTLSSGLQVATVAYVLSVVTGGSVAFDKQIIAGTAGETLANPNIAYLKEADARWWLADADSTATFSGLKIGVVQNSASAASAVNIQLNGIATGFSGLTPGAKQYLSNTAGGVSSTPGTNEFFIGWAITSTTILLAFNERNIPTTAEKAALGGSQSVPGPTNKFITQDNLSVSATDQSQTTQNGSSETGEADATTKKNILAQSFIPAKTKIRGVKLYKSADTGTFSGTVTITLEADNSGSPSGTPLATRILTNAEWLALSTGEFEAIFTSEYTSLVVGSLYWIVIDPSTSDNSNHPNLGTNTAGGYTSGSVKYKNTPDGWVAIATIDLYFKTLEGNTNQVVRTNAEGKIEDIFLNIPLGGFQQAIPSTSETATIRASGSNQDGSAFYTYNADDELRRYQRDVNTGAYILTHTGSGSIAPAAGDSGAIVVVGSFVYVFFNDGTNIECERFSASNPTTGTAMTEPVVACTSHVVAWTDGTDIYVVSAQSDTTARRWTISGTTLTEASTATVTTGLFSVVASTSMFDGYNAYVVIANFGGAGGGFKIHKLVNVNGTSVVSSDVEIGKFTSREDGAFAININRKTMYIGISSSVYDASAISNEMINLIPVSKP